MQSCRWKVLGETLLDGGVRVRPLVLKGTGELDKWVIAKWWEEGRPRGVCGEQ